MDDLLRKLERLIEVEQGKRAAGDVWSIREADAAAERIQALLLKHNLSMSDVEFRSYTDAEGVGVALWDPAAFDVKVMEKRSGWREDLSAVVARAHLCRALAIPGTNRVLFVGREADRKCAVYAYGILVQFAEQHSRSERRRLRRELRKANQSTQSAYGWREAWLRGFTVRVAQRYLELERAAVSQAALAFCGAPGTEATHAVVLSGRLAGVREEVDAYLAGLDLEDADRLTRAAVDDLSAGGMRAGWDAGGRVNLTQRALEDVRPATPLAFQPGEA